MGRLARLDVNTMTQILQHIPLWVFGLLLGLIALGLVQTRTRHIRAQRMLGINIALTIFTLVGVVQQWLNTPWLWLALASWTAACLLVTWVLGQGAAPAEASFDPETRHYTLPGSWLPLALFMTIFACKFVVGFLNATEPALLQGQDMAIGISALYGFFSGVLNGRAWRVLRLRNTP